MQNPMMRFAAPPRHVPWSLRILNLCNGGSLIGWFVFGFGMIFFWAFAGNADFSFATFRDPAGRATGTVTRVEETGASENKSPVRASHYQYSIAGRTFEGKSYTTGAAPEQGEEVTVEFDEDDPARSRIAGMRRAMFGPVVSIVAIFPAIGLAFLLFFTIGGFRRNHVLRNGILTYGKRIDKRPTNVRINNRPVWEVVFEYTDRTGQRRECSAKSTDTSRLEDETEEPLLYDPDDPSKACVLDEAPARPKFDPDGTMVGRPVAALLALIVPAIVIGAHALLFAIKYGLF